MSLDELEAAMREGAAYLRNGYCGPLFLGAMAGKCSDAADAIAALRRDAERYRAIRDNWCSDTGEWWLAGMDLVAPNGALVGAPDTPKEFDAAIDAAIAASQKDTQEHLGCKDAATIARPNPAGHG